MICEEFAAFRFVLEAGNKIGIPFHPDDVLDAFGQLAQR